MSYRDPRFLFSHAFRTAGSAALGGSSFNAAFPRARIHDSGVARFATFAGTSADQFVKADRGAGFASLPSADRLIIPAGHNLNGCTVQVRHHTSDPANGTTGTLIGSVAVTGSDLIDLALSPAASNRYVLVNFATAGTAWSFGELWLAQQRALSAAQNLDPRWRLSRLPRVVQTELESGAVFRSQKGAGRRRFRLTYNAVDATDLDVFDDLETETADGLFPFYLDDVESTHAPVLVHYLGEIERTQDHPIPSVGPTYRVELELLEANA